MKSLRLISSFCFQKKRLILYVGFMVLILCELYMRIPLFGIQLEYQPDETLMAIFRPNQTGYMWLGNMSFQSPPITINSDGHRGKETDWSKPVIIAAGNSEAFGSGVRDAELWTCQLEERLRRISGLGALQVVNAAHPGHGPFHHFIRIKRVLDIHKIEAVIVRVDIGDRYFRPYTEEELRVQLKKARPRSIVKSCTKSLPYLFNKIQAQVSSIKDAMHLNHLSVNRADANHETFDKGTIMWQQNQKWWKKMADMASQTKTPLVFIIYDPFDSSDAALIEAGLHDLASGSEFIHAFRLGSRDFGLKAESKSELKKEFNAMLTLKRDPHANSLQHKLISFAVHRYLLKTGLLEKTAKKFISPRFSSREV